MRQVLHAVSPPGECAATLRPVITGARRTIRRMLDVPGALAGMALDAVALGWRAMNRRMPDFLTLYAQIQPDKAAVIDDRPDGTVTALTFAELNAQANRLANVLLDLGVRPGETKVVWCGQNSIGIVTMVNAARKLGVTA